MLGGGQGRGRRLGFLELPMPASPEVSEADARAIAKANLALRGPNCTLAVARGVFLGQPNGALRRTPGRFF